MAAAARSKPVGLRLEPGLPLGLQRVDDPSLVGSVRITGIPNGRRLRLPGLGMYTRLTGMALNGSAFWCTLSASLALASGVSTTSPSTPAVRRPALRSVTRRTLNSVFARERSINFCNRRTLARSPAFVAVKIRCRSRRTSPSTRRQSMACQSKVASSGPFTATFAAASNLSSGSGASVIFLLTSSPDRVSALSGRTTRVRIRSVIHDDQLEAGPAPVVSRRLSATGIRFSAILFPSGSWALLTVGLPAKTAGPRRGYRVPHVRATTGVGALYTPRTAVLIPNGRTAQPAPAALPRLVLQPRSNIPPCEAPLDEASTRVQAIHPSGPSPRPRPPGWNEPPLGLSPELRTPPTRSRTTHVEEGTGHRARTWNYQLNITSGLILQSGSSLNTCDLASHVRRQQSGRCRRGCCSCACYSGVRG